METRTCRHCHIEKSISEYRPTKSRGGIFIGWKCKKCVAETAKQYALANKEKMRVAHRKWCNKNKEARRASQRKSNRKRIESGKIAEYSREYRKKNPDVNKNGVKKYREKNRERCREMIKDWEKRNPDKIREKIKRATARKATDSKQMLLNRIRTAVRRGLYVQKQGKTFEILPFTLPDLRQHLERQFRPGMSWDNMKEWHIDHIVPLSSFSFDSENDESFRVCWALTNLRPMWASDNMKKSDRRTHLI